MQALADKALCKKLNEAITAGRRFKEPSSDFLEYLNDLARRLSYADDRVSDKDRADATAFILGVENYGARLKGSVLPPKPKPSLVEKEPWMKFKATDDMALKVAFNACNAAGLNMPLEKITIDQAGTKPGIFIGNVGGIAINLHLKKVGDEWYIDEHLNDVEKHKWLQSYKTVKNLLMSVRGIRLGLQDADPKAVEARQKAEAEANDKNAVQREKDRESAKAQKRSPEERKAMKANKEKVTAEHNAPVVDPDAKPAAEKPADPKPVAAPGSASATGKTEPTKPGGKKK